MADVTVAEKLACLNYRLLARRPWFHSGAHQVAHKRVSGTKRLDHSRPPDDVVKKTRNFAPSLCGA